MIKSLLLLALLPGADLHAPEEPKAQVIEVVEMTPAQMLESMVGEFEVKCRFYDNETKEEVITKVAEAGRMIMGGAFLQIVSIEQTEDGPIKTTMMLSYDEPSQQFKIIIRTEGDDAPNEGIGTKTGPNQISFRYAPDDPNEKPELWNLHADGYHIQSFMTDDTGKTIGLTEWIAARKK